MSTLNLFPARVPIGYVRGADGKNIDVLMTQEFFRAMSKLFERVGGTDGVSNDELALLSILSPPASAPSSAYDNFEMQGAEQAVQFSSLARMFEEMQMLAASITNLNAEVQSLRRAAENAEFNGGYQIQSSVAITWDRPGAIGSAAPNSGAFTTLTASGAVTLSPASANVVLSPTGTGMVTINPATLGTMNKVAIGGTTPAAGAFTTLSATGAVTLSPANAAVTLSPTGTGTVTVNPAATGAMDNISIGATTPKPGAVTTLACTALTASANSVINTVKIGTANTSNFYVDATNAAVRPFDSAAGAGVYIQNSAGTVTWSVTTVDGLKVIAGFGCNGKTQQTAYSLGAASTDLASVIALANNLRTMSINNGIGS